MEEEGKADGYMELARRVGREAEGRGIGIGVGVVIVERRTVEEGGERVVSVAGDGRWLGSNTKNGTCRGGSSKIDGEQEPKHKRNDTGDPAAHAVLRAISFIAQKRGLVAQSQDNIDQPSAATTTIPSNTNSITTPHKPPLTPLERLYFTSPLNTLLPHGYLCLNLEIYVSHEPCVMCCMALVHSRVGRVVFGRRMWRTGGFYVGRGEGDKGYEGYLEGSDACEGESEGVRDEEANATAPSARKEETPTPSLNYGLFWREDLNWRFLAWQYKGAEGDGNDNDVSDLGPYVQV